MRFSVGPYVYVAAIAATPLFLDGHEIEGRADSRQRRIEINPGVPADGRLDVLLHELEHCWLFHFPKPRTDEELCDFHATVFAAAIQDLARQRREAEEMSIILPGAEPVPKATAATHSRDMTETWATGDPSGGTECGCCGRRFSAGEIVTLPDGDERVLRGVYCDGCGHVMEWGEKASLDGTPTGIASGRLRVLRGIEAREWLRAHGEQVGVLLG